jgi:cellulose biosynthesis protein BcsQ
MRPELRAAVVITRKVSATAIGQGARDLLSGAGLPLMRAEVGFRVAYQEAPAAGMGAAQYAPGSEAAAEVRAFTDEALELAGGKTTKRRK